MDTTTTKPPSAIDVAKIHPCLVMEPEVPFGYRRAAFLGDHPQPSSAAQGKPRAAA